MSRRRWTSRWGRSFFGLKPDDKEYVLEELFQLTYHCKVTYAEAQDMPVAIRKWWIRRVVKENEDKQKKQAPSGPAPWAKDPGGTMTHGKR